MRPNLQWYEDFSCIYASRLSRKYVVWADVKPVVIVHKYTSLGWIKDEDHPLTGKEFATTELAKQACEED